MMWTPAAYLPRVVVDASMHNLSVISCPRAVLSRLLNHHVTTSQSRASSHACACSVLLKQRVYNLAYSWFCPHCRSRASRPLACVHEHRANLVPRQGTQLSLLASCLAHPTYTLCTLAVLSLCLQTLGLASNAINPRACYTICQGILCNSGLRSIDLSNNASGTVGVR